jgi:hypothetical protein
MNSNEPIEDKIQLKGDDTITPTDIQDFKGLKLLVDCSSWEAAKAAEYFGPEWETKKTSASITNITGTKVKNLNFHISFPELNSEFKDFRWKYIAAYLIEDIPSQFKEYFDKVKANGRKKRKAPIQQEVDSNIVVPEDEHEQIALRLRDDIVDEEISPHYQGIMAAALIAFAEQPLLSQPPANPLETNIPAEQPLLSQPPANPLPPNIPAEQPFFYQPPANPLPPNIPTSNLHSPQLQAYFEKHRWVKAWYERQTRSLSRKPENENATKAGNVPRADSSKNLFKHPRYCQLYVDENSNSRDKVPCPAMALRRCGPETPMICESCSVFLHYECYFMYHQQHACDRMP